MEIFALSDVGAPCHETLGRSRELSKHVARGEASAAPAPDLIFVRVELRPRPHFPFSLRLKFSFIRLRAVQLKFLPPSTSRETSIKTKAVRSGNLQRKR